MPKNPRETKASIYHRIKFLSLIKSYGAHTITQLAEHLEVSRATVYQHLDTLRTKGFIILSKDKKKKGAPVTITLSKKVDAPSLKELDLVWDKIKRWQEGKK